MLSWLGKASSPNKKRDKSKTSGGGGGLLGFRSKFKGSSKKDSDSNSSVDCFPSPSPHASSKAVTRSQSFSNAWPLPEPGAARARSEPATGVPDLNPFGNRSCAFNGPPFPSPDQISNCDGWESPASSVGSDDHEAASDKDPGAVPLAVASGTFTANDDQFELARCNPRKMPSQGGQKLPISGKRGFPAKQVQIPVNRTLGSATDSSYSSPSSPMRAFDPNAGGALGLKQHHDVSALFGSANCSSPGSGTNSTGGDVVGHPFRGSSDRSPVPSPKLRSPGPSSSAHSAAVSPRHPRAGGLGTDSPKEGKHILPLPLPLPPRSPTCVSPFSTTASPSPRSPGSRDNPASPGLRWKKGRLLGRGTFGHVYVGFNSESGEMCAMKEVTLFADDPKSKESVKQLAQEIAVLSYLRHPNIVQYYGSEMVDDALYIYLEYVSGGSIHKLLQEYGPLGEPAIRSYTQQILSGLAYLHKKNTVHRDIKGANILVDPTGHVKVADFGMAKHISANSCPLSFKGSPYWMAPEVFKNSKGYDLAVDIWSLGCTVIEMATARPPWSQYEGIAAMFKIWNSKELPELPANLSEDGKDFIRLCLQRDPGKRPSAARLLEHQFVKSAALYAKLESTSEKSEVVASVDCMRDLNGTGHPGHAKYISSGEVEHCITPNARGWPSHQMLSDQLYSQKNRSLPLSPSGSPLTQPRSPLHRYSGMSSSPLSTPLASSGCSTPQTGGCDALSYQFNGVTRPSMFVQDNAANIPRYLIGPNPNLSGICLDPKLDVHGVQSSFRITEGSPRLQKHFAADNEVFGKAFNGVVVNENVQGTRVYSGPMALAEHVSQQFLKSPRHGSK
eukprot:TRINITY_DN26703_c0_g1_i1.p1 TRINITY_DN26703_c0_g1~~TRINITY_DN26703_c0_g1_i1.p1  ORF type:complete len:842 (+),score=87.97 TRINITY_DN26703_c0_g1_i1:179-2704(+)